VISIILAFFFVLDKMDSILDDKYYLLMDNITFTGNDLCVSKVRCAEDDEQLFSVIRELTDCPDSIKIVQASVKNISPTGSVTLEVFQIYTDDASWRSYISVMSDVTRVDAGKLIICFLGCCRKASVPICLAPPEKDTVID
jgi:hypothetical protein